MGGEEVEGRMENERRKESKGREKRKRGGKDRDRRKRRDIESSGMGMRGGKKRVDGREDKRRKEGRGKRR